MRGTRNIAQWFLRSGSGREKGSFFMELLWDSFLVWSTAWMPLRIKQGSELSPCAGVTQRLYFPPACRCVAKWLQDISLFCTAGRNLRSVNESRTDTSSLCLMESNESSQHLLLIVYATAESQVVGLSPEMEPCARLQLELWRAGVCVYTCRRRFTHLLHYRRTRGRSEASSGMSSVLFHKRLLIYGHLPSFCSVALRPLPEQHLPPLHTLFLQISFPLPTITHIHTHSYSCWLAMGRGGSVSSSVQEAMWLILIWSPVLMARTGCVLFVILLFWRLQLPADEISSCVCTGSCTVPSCNMCHAAPVWCVCSILAAVFCSQELHVCASCKNKS